MIYLLDLQIYHNFSKQKICPGEAGYVSRSYCEGGASGDDNKEKSKWKKESITRSHMAHIIKKMYEKEARGSGGADDEQE